MENHFVTKYMIDGEWQEAIDDNTTNICLYCSFYNSNSDLCSECCHANHAENEGETKVKERLEQLNHLAEVLYNESRNLYTVSKGKAQIYQSIIDEMQEQLDKIMNEILRAEQNQ